MKLLGSVQRNAPNMRELSVRTGLFVFTKAMSLVMGIGLLAVGAGGHRR